MYVTNYFFFVYVLCIIYTIVYYTVILSYLSFPPLSKYIVNGNTERALHRTGVAGHQGPAAGQRHAAPEPRNHLFFQSGSLNLTNLDLLFHFLAPEILAHVGARRISLVVIVRGFEFDLLNCYFY